MSVKFWELFDISLSVRRCIAAFSSIKGGSAIVMLILLGFIIEFLFRMVMTFDIIPTLEWSTVWVERLMQDGKLASVFFTQAELVQEGSDLQSLLEPTYNRTLLAVTLAPTIYELLAARFHSVQLTIFVYLAYIFISFDLITDVPNVIEFLTVFQPLLESMREASTIQYVLSYALEYSAIVGMSIMASIGFEVMFICAVTAAIVLIVNIVMGIFRGDFKPKRSATTTRRRRASRSTA
jgi:hypothetical protein